MSSSTRMSRPLSSNLRSADSMLDSLFNPKSVAVIGASTRELHIGNRIIKNLEHGIEANASQTNLNNNEIQAFDLSELVRKAI